jgi:hypothetical protein
MKLVRHGTTIVAIIERGWEKAYLTAQQRKRDWIPLFLTGSAQPVAEIHSKVRVCVGQQIADQQVVVLHESDTEERE